MAKKNLMGFFQALSRGAGRVQALLEQRRVEEEQGEAEKTAAEEKKVEAEHQRERERITDERAERDWKMRVGERELRRHEGAAAAMATASEKEKERQHDFELEGYRAGLKPTAETPDAISPMDIASILAEWEGRTDEKGNPIKRPFSTEQFIDRVMTVYEKVKGRMDPEGLKRAGAFVRGDKVVKATKPGPSDRRVKVTASGSGTGSLMNPVQSIVAEFGEEAWNAFPPERKQQAIIGWMMEHLRGANAR